MWQLVCVPSLPGLGHLGSELKLLNLEARQADKWKRSQAVQGPSKSSCPRVGVLYWAPTLSWKTTIMGLEPHSCF